MLFRQVLLQCLTFDIICLCFPKGSAKTVGNEYSMVARKSEADETSMNFKGKLRLNRRTRSDFSVLPKLF